MKYRNTSANNEPIIPHHRDIKKAVTGFACLLVLGATLTVIFCQVRPL